MSLKQFRVIGPPGTGKTTYLVRQVERAVEQFGVMAVRVVSFTRAAAKVVTGRLGVSDEHVGTLHHFGMRALQRVSIVRGVADTTKGIRLWNEFCGREDFVVSDSLGKSLSADDVTGEVGSVGSVGDMTFRSVSFLRSIHGADAVGRMRPMELAFHARWEEFKKQHEFVDFSDMIQRPLEMGLGFPGDPMCIFVDEAQDFTQLQWKLIRSWGERASVFVTVGDPDQVLYGWCGVKTADFYDPPDAKQMVLSQSFRVPKAVHEAAVSWIRQMPGRVDVEYRPTGEEGEVTCGHPCLKNAKSVVDEVAQELKNGNTVAVLASARYMLDPVVAELRECGIPFHNPYRPSSRNWNPVKTKAAAAIIAMTKYLEGELMNWLDIELFMEFIDSDLAGFVSGTKSNVKFMAGGVGAENPPFGGADGFMAGMAEWAPRETLMAMATGDVDWLIRNAIRSKQDSLLYPASIYRSMGISALTGVPKVIVGNIHSVKGGEADTVFLSPDLSYSAFSQWTSGDEGADEIRRVFYVGMTRARKNLRIMDASSRMAVRL